jgi:hypothetical protein
MKAFRRHVLQKAPQKLVSWQRHGFPLTVAAVAVAKRYAALVNGLDASASDRSPLDVPAKVSQNQLWPLHDRLREDDPNDQPLTVDVTGFESQSLAESQSKRVDGRQRRPPHRMTNATEQRPRCM